MQRPGQPSTRADLPAAPRRRHRGTRRCPPRRCPLDDPRSPGPDRACRAGHRRGRSGTAGQSRGRRGPLSPNPGIWPARGDRGPSQAHSTQVCRACPPRRGPAAGRNALAAVAYSPGHRGHRAGQAVAPLPSRRLTKCRGANGMSAPRLSAAGLGLCSHGHNRNGFCLVTPGLRQFELRIHPIRPFEGHVPTIQRPSGSGSAESVSVVFPSTQAQPMAFDRRPADGTCRRPMPRGAVASDAPPALEATKEARATLRPASRERGSGHARARGAELSRGSFRPGRCRSTPETGASGSRRRDPRR